MDNTHGKFKTSKLKATHPLTRRVPRMSIRHQQQKGIALITALLITSMVAIAAVSISARQQLDIRRTANTVHSDQAYLYALAAETFAKKLVKEFVAMALDAPDREMMWTAAKMGFTESIPGGSIGGNITDLDGAFPLNNIVDKDGKVDVNYLAALNRLFEILRLENAAVVNDIADWIDLDDEVRPGGAESLDYLGLDRPYRAANTQMVSLSELRLIAGFDKEGKDMNKIMAVPDPQAVEEAAAVVEFDAPPIRTEPYVNVLPRGAKINVNTAPTEVIMCLHDKITREIAEVVVARQSGEKSKLFKETKEFVELLAGEVYPKPTGTDVKAKSDFIHVIEKFELGVKSEYYEVTASAEIGSSQLTVKSLLRSENANTSSSAANNNAGKDSDKVETLRRGIGVY